MKLNVVFQGGGANVVTLMAAASALEKVLAKKKNKHIEIESITGVSAGAITACMLGSPVSVDEYREIAEQEARKVINKFSIKKKYHLPEKFQKRKIVKYSNVAWPLFNGNSLLDETDMVGLYKEIFQNEALKPIKTLKNISIPTYITSTDLVSNERVTFERDTHPEMPIEDILAHSTAVPLVFRSFGSGGRQVDGGLSGNLPIGLLDRNAGEDSRILAFGFKNLEEEVGDNLLAYCSRILSASIDGAVAQNMKRIEACGGKIIELDKNYSLIEFERAINEGLVASKFKIISEGLEAEVEKKIDEMSSDANEYQNIDELRENIKKSYGHLENNSFFEKVSRVTIVTLNSLNPYIPKHDAIDKLTQEIHFYPDEGGAQVVSANLVLLNQPNIKRSSSHVVDKDRNPIDAIKFDAARVVTQDGSRTFLNSFYILNRNYTKSDDHFIITQTTKGNLCPDFKNFGYDYTRHKPNLDAGTAEYIAIFLVPINYTERDNLTLYDLKKYSKLIEIKEGKEIPNASDMANNWVNGKKLSNNEIREYLGVIPQDEYHVLAWKVKNIPKNHYCGVFIADKTLISSAELSACEDISV